MQQKSTKWDIVLLFLYIKSKMQLCALKLIHHQMSMGKNAKTNLDYWFKKAMNITKKQL